MAKLAISILTLLWLAAACMTQPANAAGYSQDAEKERTPAVEGPLASPGVVVEEKGSVPALDQSGIQPGDVLLSWRQSASRPRDHSPSQGSIASIFDWFWLQTDKGPAGTIVLELKRSIGFQSISVTTGLMEVKVRPNLSEAILEIYKQGASEIKNGDLEDGLCWWDQIARLARKESDSTTLAWILIRIATTRSEHGDWSEAALVLESALREKSNPSVRSVLLDNLGSTFRRWGKTDFAFEIYRTALEERLRLSGDSVGVARAYLNLGLTLQNDLPPQAKIFLQEAVTLLQNLAPESTSLASALNTEGILFLEQEEFTPAQLDFEASLQLYNQREPGGLNAARVMNNLGMVAYSKSQLSQARDWHRAALNLRKLLAPCSAEVEQSLQHLSTAELNLGNRREARQLAIEALGVLRDSQASLSERGLIFEVLGEIEFKDGDLNMSEQYYRLATDMFRKIAPDSRDVLRAMANTSVILSAKGDLEGTEILLKEAIHIGERISPEGLAITQPLTNLGLLKRTRGELDEAEDLLQRSLRIIKRRMQGSEDEAAAENNLGIIAFDRGDLDEATFFHRRSLEIAKTLPRPNLDEAHSLTNLGNIAAIKGQYQEAEGLYKSALKIKESMTAGSHEIASSLGSLGHLYWLKGDLGEARKYFEALFKLPGDDPPLRALNLIDLGTILTDSKEFEDGLARFQEALIVIRRHHLAGLEEATALHGIGKILRAQGKEIEALRYLQDSVETLDSYSTSMVGGTEDVKARFRSQYEEVYLDLADLLIEEGQAGAALRTLEGYRARGLLNMLAERDLSFPKDLPLDLNRERQSLERKYDGVQDLVSRGLASNEDLIAIQSRLTENARQIAKASPRLAALRHPRPISAEEARSSLDAGTVMLYYYVGREKTALWVVEAQGEIALRQLSLSREQIQTAVGQYRSLLLSAKVGSSAHRSALLAASESLYQKLVLPAEEILERNRRILIIPDGALRELPFASLARRVNDRASSRGWQYVGEWKPIHTALSVTLFSQLKPLRRIRDLESDGIVLAAFGDPTFPVGIDKQPDLVADARVRSMVRHRFDFSPLPASRIEVEEVVNLFPGGAKAYLGSEATEIGVKSLPQDTRIVHFATHATLDERFPLNSAVVLSIPEKFEEGKDNGLLQAWEIFEQVRLDANLVVLSACESGLGKEMGGEGLIGLTRAFQYAGARSVMASLWKISDRTTAGLMVRFYQHLKAGLPKDEALRAAQMELIRGPIQVKNEKGEVETIDASAPYYWAAFQIYGDWQ